MRQHTPTPSLSLFLSLFFFLLLLLQSTQARPFEPQPTQSPPVLVCRLSHLGVFSERRFDFTKECQEEACLPQSVMQNGKTYIGAVASFSSHERNEVFRKCCEANGRAGALRRVVMQRQVFGKGVNLKYETDVEIKKKLSVNLC